jgi:hypothetical protein
MSLYYFRFRFISWVKRYGKSSGGTDGSENIGCQQCRYPSLYRGQSEHLGVRLTQG